MVGLSLSIALGVFAGETTAALLRFATVQALEWNRARALRKRYAAAAVAPGGLGLIGAKVRGG